MTKLMLWRPRSLVVAKYGNAILAVGAVVILTQWMETLLPSTPQVSLLLCAVMVSAWFGGFGPGLVAVVLSSGAFAFFFLAPFDRLEITFNELPRLVVFIVSALLVGTLSATQRRTAESLRRARDDLYSTVQELQRTNAALYSENIERKRAEEQLTQAAQQLEQRVAERTHELLTLLEISNTIASTLELQPLLHVVLDQLQAVVHYTDTTIFVLEGDELVVLGHRGPSSSEQIAQLRFPAAQAVDYQAVRNGGPIIIDDLQADNEQARAFRESAQMLYFMSLCRARSLMVVPLIVRERLIGILWVGDEQTHAYTPHDAQLALVFANQAAAAIENARLYNHARDIATIEERQRLARELHDAVTQTLFSASLIAEALPEAWRRSPEKAQRGVEELRLLTRGALAEMRTLLLELRPASITEKPLGELLNALCASVTSRTRIPIQLHLRGEALLAPPIQIALYRIIQEVLNNIAKHAAASQVIITGSYESDHVEIRITDNGRGFDPSSLAPGSLGLDIMRERAANIGAMLQLDSQPGQGTEVRLEWWATSMVRMQGGIV